MESEEATSTTEFAVQVRPLREEDLPEADRIFHLAFGTFLGLPYPMQFYQDRDYVIARWRADPSRAFGVENCEELVGSNFATSWGSFGFLGPLTIRPDQWDRGLAKRMLGATMELFEAWNTQNVGLFTFPDSTRHVHLYQKFGFWPQFLTSIMSSPVRPLEQGVRGVAFSELTLEQQAEAMAACCELTDSIYAGLDVLPEIRAVSDQSLGDTLLLWDLSRLGGFAVCHCGAGTEAGDDTCYVKFGAARTRRAFVRLLDACECFALRRGLSRLEAGVNLACHDAYQMLLARGFHADILGLAMHRPNHPGYNRAGVYVLGDWR